MKKDKEWLKEEALKLYPDNTDIYEHPDYIVVEKTKIVSDFLELIDQLEEPEQEKVVVPQFVGDFITEIKPNFNIRAAFTLQNNNHEQGQEWALDNPDVFARAWLDGYSIEKEKRYTACFTPIGTRQGVYLYRESGSVKVGDNMKVYDKNKQEYHLTEQEIKNRDERFWAFAEEITK